MSIEAMKMAIEALEQLQGGCTDSDDGTVEAITVWCPEVIDALRQAIEQAEQKTAVSPDKGTGFIDGAWHCQCGKAYEVTCISSKPKGKSWKS